MYCTSVHLATVLYCTVLYCTVLNCNVLYCTVLYTSPPAGVIHEDRVELVPLLLPQAPRVVEGLVPDQGGVVSHSPGGGRWLQLVVVEVMEFDSW